MINITTEEEFKTEVLESKIPVVVDFWATWCGPCQTLSPTIEELDNEYSHKIKFVKIDVDKDNKFAIASKYSVRGVPTLIIFKDGIEKSRSVGLHSKDEIIKMLMKRYN